MTPSIDRTLHQFLTITDLDLITEFDFLPNCTRFPWNICNRCGMPTEDAYSSGHLVLSHFGTCMCSNVETNLSWTCLVSGLLNFEQPSVLLFCFKGQLIESAARTAEGRSRANLLIEKSVNVTTEFTLICTHYVPKFFLSKMAAPVSWRMTNDGKS